MATIKNSKINAKPSTTNSDDANTNIDAVIKENEKLAKENKELSESISTLMKQMQELSDKINSQSTVANDSPEDPNANKQIKVMSMFYGELNLCNSINRSSGKIITFDKFGQIKSILYHDLVDYVNTERKFAEEGYFYILDKDAVYSLGLSPEYEKLASAEIMNNITTYSDTDVEAIVSVMPDAQRKSMCNIMADRMYHGLTYDLNKLNIIKNVTGIDIQAMANEKKEVAEKMKATSGN